MIRKSCRWLAAVVLSANLAMATIPGPIFAADKDKDNKNGNSNYGVTTTTPIKHLVVIFQENVSFDHYFGSYPEAQNNPGETVFTPRSKKANRTVNGLTQGLIDRNTNHIGSTLYPPIRLDPSKNYTCSQNHDYMPEQQAFDSGLMDKFPQYTYMACSATTYSDISGYGPGIVMGYYDGNTVSGLWNYAQYFAINDNFFGSNFGPSTVGALNVVSGMTGGVDLPKSPTAVNGTDIYIGTSVSSVIGDPDPAYDDCSTYDPVGMLSSDKNIGDFLTTAGITWGWFQGGFNPIDVSPYGTPSKWTEADCTLTTNRMDLTPETAYSPHHNPFEYYLSTSNQHHLPPSSVSAIGTNTDQANHEYDLTAFWAAAKAGHMPSVSYLKANRAQDGHPGNSSPLDEQAFIVDTLNKLQALPEWNETAVIITYDDSDGWYDHAMSPIINQSATADDAINGTGMCGTGVSSLATIQGRCGYGPRLPFLVVSPYAKQDFVDNTLTDQSSVVRFIEDNWGLSPIGNGSFDEDAGTLANMFTFNKKSDQLNGVLLLNPATGMIVAGGDK